MKINSIHLKDFRIHERLAVPLDNITVIVGPNGSGKSSIKAALEYALTGRCEWTDGRGAGADGLVRDGAKQAVVAVDIEGLGIVKRTVPNSLEVEGLQGNTTTQQGALMQKLRATEQTVAAALNTTGFLSLDKATQKGLLFDLLGFSFTREEILEKIVKACSEKVGCRAVEWASKEIPEGTYGPEVFAELEGRAVSDRRAKKRQLKELEALAKTPVSVTLPEGVTAEDKPAMLEQFDALRKERDEAMKALGEARSVVRAREEQAREIEKLRATVAAAEKVFAEAGAGPDDVRKVREKAGKVGLKLDQKLEERARAAASLAAAHTKRVSFESAIAAIEKATGKCPLAPSLLACPMSADDLRTLVGKLKNDLAAVEGDIRKGDKALKELDSEIAAFRKEKADLEAEADRLERQLANHQEAQESLTSARALLAQAEQTMADLSEAPDISKIEQAIDTLSQRIVRGEDLLTILRRYELAVEAQKNNVAAWRECQEDLQVLETLCDALGPKGIRAQILGEAVAALQAHANKRCSALTGGEYSIEFRVEEDLEILVARRGFAPRSVSQLSTSEKFRTGLVVQDVLNSLTVLRLLVIDGADVLDVENRALMMSMLLEIREDYDTILVLSTLGDVEPADPGISGVSVYVLRNGELVAAPKAA